MQNFLTKYLTERNARYGIYLVSLVTLMLCILFAGSAHIISAGAVYSEDPLLEEYDVELLLRQIELLETRLGTVEQELDGTQQQNAHLLETLAEVESGFSIEYAGSFYATAYCTEEYPHICGGNGVTASGTKPTPGLTIAADWTVLPAGTWVYIDGVGMRRVEDRGSAIKGNKIDVVIDTHANALAWDGQGNHDVWIVTWDVEE